MKYENISRQASLRKGDNFYKYWKHAVRLKRKQEKQTNRIFSFPAHTNKTLSGPVRSIIPMIIELLPTRITKWTTPGLNLRCAVVLRGIRYLCYWKIELAPLCLCKVILVKPALVLTVSTTFWEGVHTERVIFIGVFQDKAPTHPTSVSEVSQLTITLSDLCRILGRSHRITLM